MDTSRNESAQECGMSSHYSDKAWANQLSLCISIAASAHHRTDRPPQLDRGGEPYILHPLKVMTSLPRGASRLTQCASVLHDVVEDCGSDGFSLEFLKSISVFTSVLDVVKLLTYEKGTCKKSYIMNLAKNESARLIKIEDLIHNSSILRLKGLGGKDIIRTIKYHHNYTYLNNFPVYGDSQPLFHKFYDVHNGSDPLDWVRYMFPDLKCRTSKEGEL